MHLGMDALEAFELPELFKTHFRAERDWFCFVVGLWT